MAFAMTELKAPEPISWVKAIAPYVPGRATTDDGRKVVKLSANENPLGTSEKARAAFAAAAAHLERYPDPGAQRRRRRRRAPFRWCPADSRWPRV